MEALRQPVSATSCVMQAKQDIRTGKTPVNIWGAAEQVRPLIMDVLEDAEPKDRKGSGGKNARQILVVTYDDARADVLYHNYRCFNRDVYIYPSKDVLFYAADVHGNLAARKRLEIVKRLIDGEPTVIILTVEGLMDRLPSPSLVKENQQSLTVGQEVDLTVLSRRLSEMGYESVAFVEIPGQYALRGGIMDIFPLTEECPYRIELWGDEISSIRAFDAGSQRSIEEVEELEVLPATEYVIDADRLKKGMEKMDRELETAVKAFRKDGRDEQCARIREEVQKLKDGLQDFSNSATVDGLVNFFFDEVVSFLDYLPPEAQVFIDEPARVEECARAYFEQFRQAMLSRLEEGSILPGQANVLFTDEEILGRLENQALVTFTEFEDRKHFQAKDFVEMPMKSLVSYGGRMEEMAKEIRHYRKDGYAILFFSTSGSKGKHLVETLDEYELPAFFSRDEKRVLQPREIMVTEGNLETGFQLTEARLVVLTESEVLRRDKKKTRRQKKRFSGGDEISSLRDLNVGDYVVHEQHGIGIYRGIEQIDSDGRKRDYITISYAAGGKLFIPVDHLSMIGKYADKTAEAPKLHKLGGEAWDRVRARVKKRVDDMADELIQLYADRMNSEGHQYPQDTVEQAEFEETFPYEETQDQIRAIEDTKRDMESGRIMDRLICGDVGFGKTEVAIRAAFKAVDDGRQVAYLVPTTILAQQHYENFAKRLEGFPIEVRMLSRFCTPREVASAIAGLKAGTVDIVIGTHRILSKDVKFKKLGLLIIDEEQRFGVKHKEAIKQMKKTVDVLTLTATPIPRTLHMSLVGIRDMSLLREAPVDRRPIQTYVMEYDREMVREACRRELARNGQVYYVYNRVENIASVADELQQLLPDARIAYAHGKMSPRELEQLMREFIDRDIDILVTTTIIETGLDIPNVNTIIIHGADSFGLSQLYQLRGRVGRSGRNAYAFLMYRKDKLLREVAEKRLAAIREFTELGSGYKISMKDLEIRGSGNVLGSSQSGHMEEVGYDLYVKMLASAIRKKQGREEEVEEEAEVQIDIPIDAYIPDIYVRSEYLKLELYKRIYRIRVQDDADMVEEEMRDRFGEIPKPVAQLIRVALIKAEARKACITEIKYTDGEMVYIIRDGTAVRVNRIPELLAKFKGMRLVRTKKSGFAIPHSKLIQEELLDHVEKEVKAIYDMLIRPEGTEQGDHP